MWLTSNFTFKKKKVFPPINAITCKKTK